tara:strand:+ start:74 stop:463 length:390 start_codon:yes stop_codon:yes gene_type:complete
MEYKLCLVAYSGDKSAGAMGDKNTVYLFDNKHKKYVDDFLKAQLNFDLYALDKDFPNGSKKFYKKYLSTFHKLQDLGIFIDKWDFRTHWSMEIYDELKELKMFKPYKLEPNGLEVKLKWEKYCDKLYNK